MDQIKDIVMDKKKQVVFFSATAIALYGYDQGMMSLINTNKDYLATMGIQESSPLVGVIVSIYYLGCSAGAVIFSWLADKRGRKPGLWGCLLTAAIGNLLMFASGLGFDTGALAVMFLGRVVMGLGVGGIDSVVPVYSSELSDDGARGKGLALEFQSNIFGLNMAFAINLGLTVGLGKSSQWAWRLPIVIMQLYPLLLFSFIHRLPESPIWLLHHDRKDDAKSALIAILGEDDGAKKAEEMIPRDLSDSSDSEEDQEEEEEEESVGYRDMLTPSHPQFHPTIITIMGQVNQALTGYGAVSVYGPQIFELLGFGVRSSEYLTQGNYVSYFLLMTFSWLLIDAVGRRPLLLWGSAVLTFCFLLLALFGGLASSDADNILGSVKNHHQLAVAVAVPGVVSLFVATGAFGIAWLVPPWLIPTELYPTAARAQGTAISVIVWGLANFAVTLLTPLMFHSLSSRLFLVFAATNCVAGAWTYLYCPESGGRSFDEYRGFFDKAAAARTWRVAAVDGGAFLRLPYRDSEGEVDESRPLLARVGDQVG